MMITESFDRKTLAAMEIALDVACEHLGYAKDQHDARRHIASKILDCALRGDRTPGGLTEAGRMAAMEVAAMEVAAMEVAATKVAGVRGVGGA